MKTVCTGYGAEIERGTIVSVESNGYIVKSIDRDGITSTQIKAISGSYSVGDKVVFFLFRDGTGKIICSM